MDSFLYPDSFERKKPFPGKVAWKHLLYQKSFIDENIE